MATTRVYLDYNATTPVHPDILPLVRENLTKFGNPSSVHWAGRESKQLLTQSREGIAKFIHCSPLEIIFTAGGSEGNNLALKGILDHGVGNRKEIVCSEVEHPSVLKTVAVLEKQGFKIRWLKVNRQGSIDLQQLKNLVSDNTALVTCQLVNNETGNIFPLKEISALAHEAGALVHSDMVQALGKIPVDLKALDVDFATFAGHKFYGLKGAGVLFVRSGIHVESLISGGGQERNRRAGTENALAIASMGDAARLLGPQLKDKMTTLEKLRDDLEAMILNEIPFCRVNGGSSRRVPNTINVTVSDVDGETLLINLDTRGFAVSSGAACSSGSQEPSPVLVSMGLTGEEASQSLRISLGWLTTKQETDLFFENLKTVVSKMREIHESDEIERDA